MSKHFYACTLPRDDDAKSGAVFAISSTLHQFIGYAMAKGSMV